MTLTLNLTEPKQKTINFWDSILQVNPALKQQQQQQQQQQRTCVFSECDCPLALVILHHLVIDKPNSLLEHRVQQRHIRLLSFDRVREEGVSLVRDQQVDRHLR